MATAERMHSDTRSPLPDAVMTFLLAEYWGLGEWDQVDDSKRIAWPCTFPDISYSQLPNGWSKYPIHNSDSLDALLDTGQGDAMLRFHCE